MMKLENWLHGLFGGFIGGASSAGSAYLGLLAGHNLDNSIPELNWKGFGIVMLTSGMVSALAYLKQSPLPEVSTTVPTNPPTV